MPEESRNVLVVDNDYFLAKVLERKLRAIGFNVTLVQNQAELDEILRDTVPDFLLIEITAIAPEPAGYVFGLLMEKSLKDTSICILTRLDDDELQKSMVEAGVSAYLRKDEVSFDDIVLNINKCIARSSSHHGSDESTVDEDGR